MISLQSARFTSLFLVLPLLLLSACSPPTSSKDSGAGFAFPEPVERATAPSGTEAAPETLIDEWYAIAARKPEEMDMHRAFTIAQELAQLGRENLEAIFAVLEDPSQSDGAKMLAVPSLGMLVQEDDLERLHALTAPEHSLATRGCATHLLGSIENDEARALLEELAKDETIHVRKIALLVLMRHGNQEAANKAAELWFLPEATDADRTEIIYGFPEIFASTHLELYADALNRSTLEGAVHYHALQILKNWGGPKEAPSIQKFIDATEYAQMESFARDVLATVQARKTEEDS
ncbi:MAG: HEAT repeat domain-containing protein [Candidatus Hydrogenedens sp.]|jgi:hypothetical protein|nr:HEAT repeat domain-containing protein [Candidatus Hydrogenedens sp.]